MGQPAEIPAAVLPVRQQIAVTLCISVVGVQSYIQSVHLGHPIVFVFFPLPWAQQPLVSQDLLFIETSRSHSDKPQSLRQSSGRVINPTERPLPDNTHAFVYRGCPRS